MKMFACTMVAAWLAAAAPACLARTHTVRPSQELPMPTPDDASFGLKVAIDGDAIITIGEAGALLYRRGTNGQWAFGRVLLAGAGPDSELAMKNGIAVVRSGGVHVYTRQGADYVESVLPDEAKQATGMVAISARRVAVQVSPCRDDTLLLTESSPGSWAV